MTLLSIAQQICREVGIAVPTAIVSSSDETAKRLIAVLQTSGRILASGKISLPNGYVFQHNWTALMKEQTFNTAIGTASYALSGAGTIITDADFDRFVPGTRWDRSNQNEIYLFTPAEWQESKSGVTTLSSVTKRVRKRGRFLVIDPTPTAIESLVFEYMSNKWCQSSGGTAQSSWVADTDTPIVDEDLMMLDGKWRYLNRIGESYAEEMKEYLEALALKAGADITPDTVHFTKGFKKFIDGNHGNYNCLV